METLSKALGFLKKTSRRGIVPGLSRIRELLRRMGDPQEITPVVHVSGTNGKGSFGAVLTSVLTSAGYRTGGFSSPALTGITDSFRINCKETSMNVLSEIILHIAEIWEDMDDKPTEFEVLTAAAYELFAREACDIAVVECGLGGDEDSTNVISAPLLSVITNVRLDHCGMLGSTEAEIASHKAGIIKPGRPVYYGGAGDALEVIRGRAAAMGSEMFLPAGTPQTISSDLDGTVFAYCGKEYKLSLLGSYQPENAANALECVKILRKYGLDIPDKAIARGLAEVRWHGRFELLRLCPVIIADGAHNPDGISRAAESIRQYFGEKRVALLIGVMADKDYRCYPELLGGLVDRVFSVKPANPRSLDSVSLAETFSSHGIPAEHFETLSEGVRKAYDYAKNRKVPLIALGSLYMYKEFVGALEDAENDIS